VLDIDDKPIAGLYAAGSTVGGLDGGPHAGYVGGLIKATIGLRAAEAIAGKS
jgi:predicted oxidoreductase